MARAKRRSQRAPPYANLPPTSLISRLRHLVNLKQNSAGGAVAARNLRSIAAGNKRHHDDHVTRAFGQRKSSGTGERVSEIAFVRWPANDRGVGVAVLVRLAVAIKDLERRSAQRVRDSKQSERRTHCPNDQFLAR